MVQEFSLQTSNYAAEYGQVQGGVFILATRSGTNQIHGDAWEYWQNNLLDAKKPFVYTAALDRKNDFGATFSGPVFIPKLYNGRNKAFFFLIFEDARNSVSSAGALNTMPTLAYRQGDFSGALTGGRSPEGIPKTASTTPTPPRWSTELRRAHCSPETSFRRAVSIRWPSRSRT